MLVEVSRRACGSNGGYDHRFGRNREGDSAAVDQLGEAFDFQVEEIPRKRWTA